ncbi:hypothetical protein [Stenotrophomonas sp.]|uniref:hypothetical protein n=1 Tax=Stenotrophomonas sp. TaxID=69392 RepID=UPI002FC5E2F6
MDLPGRRPPFVVHLPAAGEPAPARVSHLRAGQVVVVSGAVDAGTSREVAFDDHGPRWANPGLRAVLSALNAQGLPFQFQPHDPEAPAALMAWWQESGQLDASFHQFSWRGAGTWGLTRIDLPQRGVLGWAGPRPFGQ